MKYCSNCGSKLETHMAFCTGCGTQASKPLAHEKDVKSVQQAHPQPIHHAGTHHYARKNTSYIIVTLVAVIAIVGIVLFITQSETIELVGTWEFQESTRWGEERVVYIFNRDGTGRVVNILNDILEYDENFDWTVMNDSQLLITIPDPLHRHELIDFSVSSTALILDGYVFTRRQDGFATALPASGITTPPPTLAPIPEPPPAAEQEVPDPPPPVRVPEVAVPNLIGMTFSDARDLLWEVGLTAVFYYPNFTSWSDLVEYQFPVAGTYVQIYRSVLIE